MATPEDLRAFDAKKAEVMMSLDLIGSYVMYISKTRLGTRHSTLVAFAILLTKPKL